MKYDFKKIAIPKTRDPFVNAQLIPAGVDPDTGEERFWMSTWNSIIGSIGVLITESGKNRIYHFDAKKQEFGFYGASYAGNDIMWVSCFLDSITKLDLKTGKTQTWNTGMPHALSSSGLVYDNKTKKVFFETYCRSDFKNNGLSFNTETKNVSKVFNDIPLKNKQLRHSLKNLDGTYTFISCVPEVELLLWNPISDKVEVILESFNPGNNCNFFYYLVVIQRDDGAIYLPQLGWFDPLKRKFVSGNTPSKEATWFGIDNDFAYGCESLPLGDTILYKWNLKTGKVDFLSQIPDAIVYGFNLTKNNKIVCVNMYGFFYRIDAKTGAIECSVKLDSDSIGHIDCLYQIDDNRLLCTPFITQRFYEINLKTNKSIDLGRASGGRGEILQIEELNEKIYMASYNKGQLVEYDPLNHAHFPENPRIVVNPLANAMRPVALCKNDKSIFYSCSLEYGHLGSMMIKYTPKTSNSLIVPNTINNQMIRSLIYNQKQNLLIGATSYHADCNSCVPIDNFCVIAILNQETLLPKKSIKVKGDFDNFNIFGLISDNKYLCGGVDHHIELDRGYSFYVLDLLKFKISQFSLPVKLTTKTLTKIYATNVTGMFIFTTKEHVELWDLEKGIFVKKLCDNPGIYKAFVQDDKIYLICKKDIYIVSF